MKNILLIIALAFLATTATAHNPLTAKFELDATVDNGAILHVYLSQVGLHQALIKHYKEKDFTNISPKEYKKLATLYVKKHTAITANQQLLEIGEGGIKLGNHQTDFKFTIKNYPTEVTDLAVKINAFQENGNHYTMFWWNRKSGKSKVILSAKNDFKGTFKAAEQTVQTVASAAIPYKKWLGLGVSSLILLTFLFIRHFNKKV